MILEKPGQVGQTRRGPLNRRTVTPFTHCLNSNPLRLKPDGNATSDRTAPGQQLGKYLSIFRCCLSV